MVSLSRRVFVAGLAAWNPVLRADPKRLAGRTPPRLFDIERALPAIRKYRRDAIRLHPKRLDASLPPGASKMGGLFLWPAGEPWPYCGEQDPPYPLRIPTLEAFIERAREAKLLQSSGRAHSAPPMKSNDLEAWEKWNRDSQAAWERLRAKGLPELTPAEAAEAKRRYLELMGQLADQRKPHNQRYQAIVQLRRDEFPELPWPAETDLFQLLWCPRVHFWGNSSEPNSQGRGAKVVWRQQASVRRLLDVQSPVPAQFPVHECVFQPEVIVEYPQAEETPFEIRAAIPKLQGWFDSLAPRSPDDPDANWRYSYDIAVAPGTKLLGYPQWVQSEETPRCVCGRRMKLLLTCASQEDSNSRIWNAEPRQLPPQTAGDFERWENPFGFQWGDWSNAFVFFCASTHRVRTRTIVQTS